MSDNSDQGQSFSYIHYDRVKNKIHLWEKFGQKTIYTVHDHKVEYYYGCDHKTSLKSIYGENVEKRVKNKKYEVENLKREGIKTFETDFSEETKFLYKHFKEPLEPKYENYRVASLDIEVAVEPKFIWLRNPSPDLAIYDINLITIDFIGEGLTYTLGTTPYTGNSELVKNYILCKDEKDLLNKFIKLWKASDIDIVTGWNVDGFDIKYIIHRMIRNGIDYNQLSQTGNVIEKKKDGRYKIPGVNILDYMALYKKFTFNVKTLPSYSLQSVSMEELGEGKLEYEGSINTFYKTDWNKFVEYNIQDAHLVSKIENKLKFIQLAIRFCSEALVPFERVYSSICVIEGYIYQYLHNEGYVFPDFPYEVQEEIDLDSLEDEFSDDEDDEDEKKGIEGGYVEAHSGFYYNLLSYDVESLYPNMIMAFNISPETKVIGIDDDEARRRNLIFTPINGVYYTREPGIFPKIVKKVFDERRFFKKKMKNHENLGELAEAAYYNLQQMTRKIFINSVYGVLGNKFFHFFDEDNANAVTAGGRDLIKFLAYNANDWLKFHFKKKIKKHFPEYNLTHSDSRIAVLLDTDSCYLNLDEIVTELHKVTGKNKIELMNILDDEYIAKFFKSLLNIYAEKYGIENIINFKREKVITKMYIQKKKKYITQIVANEEVVYDKPKLKFTGIEIVRSDTPLYCREKLEEFFSYMFDQERLDYDDLNQRIKDYYKEFKTQDPKYVSINKAVKEYEKYCYPGEWYIANGLSFKKRTPMHVKSAAHYNYLIQELNLPLSEISSGNKTKIVYLKKNNFLGIGSLSFIGNWPEEFNEHFKIDFEMQFQKYFIDVVQRMFDIVGLGQIIVKKTMF